MSESVVISAIDHMSVILFKQLIAIYVCISDQFCVCMCVI